MSMTEETLRRSLEFIVGHCASGSEISVSFFGGEALLHLDRIEDAIWYLKGELGNNVRFDLSTNGLLLTPSNVERLIALPETTISVSLDGCKSVHDRNRKDIGGRPTFDRIVAHLKSFKEKHGPEYCKRIRLLVTAGSLDDISLMDEHFPEFSELLGERPPLVSHIFPNFEKRLFYRDSLEKKRQFVRDAIGYQSKGLTNFHTILLDNLRHKAGKKITGSLQSGRIRLRTCLDCLYSVYISATGLLYPCEKFGEAHSIGTVGNGFDERKLRHLTYSYVLRRSLLCSRCSYVSYCDRCLADSKMTISEQRIMCEDYKENIQLALQMEIV